MKLAKWQKTIVWLFLLIVGFGGGHTAIFAASNSVELVIVRYYRGYNVAEGVVTSETAMPVTDLRFFKTNHLGESSEVTNLNIRWNGDEWTATLYENFQYTLTVIAYFEDGTQAQDTYVRMGHGPQCDEGFACDGRN